MIGHDKEQTLNSLFCYCFFAILLMRHNSLVKDAVSLIVGGRR